MFDFINYQVKYVTMVHTTDWGKIKQSDSTKVQKFV